MRLICIALLLVVMAGCRTATTATQDTTGAFVTLLGQDTLAVERFSHTDSGMRADVVLRTPTTSVRSYDISFDGDWNLARYEASVRSPLTGEERRETVVLDGDSLHITSVRAGGEQHGSIAGDGSMLPFIDMVHWPFELALIRASDAGADSLTQRFFTSRGEIPFVVRAIGRNEFSLQHPFRGTMTVEVDGNGRLQTLDAGETTRALTVRRVADVDIDALAETFAARDAAGASFGPLSGRGETEATVGGATIHVDYGRPAKRGREIWGGLVAWDELWRTGANRATHFQTDRALQFGDLTLPAGTYTLFSIPASDGGILIINSETGQNGNSYDASHDFGRIPMELRALDEEVELFTIAVDETETGGELRLQWDRSELVAPFRIPR